MANYTVYGNISTISQYHNFCMFLGSYIGSVVVIGTIMNMVVLVGLLRYRKYLDISSTIVMNQAACDLVAPMFGYPLSSSSSFNCAWLHGRSACVYYGFVTSFGGYCSMINLSLLSVERFITIAYPLRRERLLNARNITIAISLVWIFGFIWAILPVIGISSYEPEGIGTMCSVTWFNEDDVSLIYNIALVIGVYCVPMGIIALCYLRFLSEIFKIGSRAAALQGHDSDMSAAAKKMERQQTCMVLLMVIFFNIAWLPYTLASVIAILGYSEIIGPVEASLPAAFAKTSHAANPIIYCVLNKNFRSFIFGRGNKVSPELSMIDDPSDED